jgi:hypothetical protein
MVWQEYVLVKNKAWVPLTPMAEAKCDHLTSPYEGISGV